MKVYIVYKAYWMQQTEVDSVYFTESIAKDRQTEILKSSEQARSYVVSYEVVDSLPWKTINEYRQFIHDLLIKENNYG